jgi:hypothetical protein
MAKSKTNSKEFDLYPTIEKEEGDDGTAAAATAKANAAKAKAKAAGKEKRQREKSLPRKRNTARQEDNR